MTEYATGYQPISAYCDDDIDNDHQGDGDAEAPPLQNFHVTSDKNKGNWTWQYESCWIEHQFTLYLPSPQLDGIT